MASNQESANALKGCDAEVKLLSTVDQYHSSTNALTALVGGAQAGTALATEFNRFTSVATANDSAQLPVSEAGLDRVVFNSGAASLRVFPKTGDTINALAANTGFDVAVGKTCRFSCPVAGKWFALLSA